MKIKYKISLLFSALILIVTLPLAILLPARQESTLHSLVVLHGNLYSRLLSRLALNILIANAADIDAAKVDTGEILSMFEFLSPTGLVYADCVLLSGNPHPKGTVLSSKAFTEHTKNFSAFNSLLSDEELQAIDRGQLIQTTFPGIEGKVFMFASAASILGRGNVCAGRLFFSESALLAPARKLRILSYLFIAGAIFIAACAALFFSRIISQPIEKLTEGLLESETEGAYKPLHVESTDEIGRLATTFNHLLRMLNLHVKGLMESNRELQRIDSLKNEFLAHTSLELQSPLNAIAGIADALLSGTHGQLNENAKKDVSLIMSSAGRLYTLVNAMLDFSRLKNKDISLDLVCVDIHSVAEAVIASLRPRIEKKGLTVVNKIHHGEFMAEADEGRLYRIFLNLIENAVKHTEKGKVEISAQKVSDCMIEISVEDTGIGISPEKINTIFEPFEQDEISFAHSSRILGLGLPITKKLVELHGGTIHAHTSPGKGSTFTFTLRESTGSPSQNKNPLLFPEITDELLEVHDLHIAPSDAIGAKPILAVDDDPLNLHMLKSFLSLYGYEVMGAQSGEEALDILGKNNSIALVILDVMMPHISGYDVARIIRKTYQSHELPIIMLTARGYQEDIVAGFEAGANDYLTKPINRPELLARVKSLMALKESAREHNELSILRHDMGIAHAIQSSLLPLNLPAITGITLAVRYLPITDLGGDLYDFSLDDDGSLDVLIADASGHGIPAALISAMTSISYRLSGLKSGNLAEKMTSINRAMCRYEHGQFITACLVKISPDRRELAYSNAGHWPFIIIRGANLSPESYRDEGIPLGWLQEAGYTENRIPLYPGNRIILFTDGFIECRDNTGKIFGMDRFQKIAQKQYHESPERCADLFIEEAKRWAGKNDAFRDDVTLIIIDIA